MIKLPRIAVAVFTLLFGLSHAVLGYAWVNSYAQPSAAVVAILMYVAALIPSVVFFRGKYIPQSLSIANFTVAIAVVLICTVSLEENVTNTAGNYTTWFVGGVSTLLAVTVMRGSRILGWTGVAALWLITIQWGGPSIIFKSGLIGALLLVAATDAISVGFERIEVRLQGYLAQAAKAAAQTARLTATRIERKTRLQSALVAALPSLERIVESGGKLKTEDKQEVLLTEAALRDEIQGKKLIDDGVRIAARDARKRGVEVSIIDSGGIDSATAFEALAIRTSIAQAISSASEGNVAVRAPKAEKFMVSIVAQRPGVDKPDLWLRLP